MTVAGLEGRSVPRGGIAEESWTREAALALLAILLVAAGLRLWGLGHDLPFSYYGDELYLMKRAMAMGTGDLNPHWFHKPALLMYVLAFCYGLYYAAGRLTGAWGSTAAFGAHFLTAPGPFLLIGRLVVCACGIATVYAVYRLARRAYGSVPAALGAALVAAVLVPMINSSQEIKSDIPCALLMTLSLGAYLGVRETASARPLVAASLLAGAAMGMHYYAMVLPPTYAACEIGARAGRGAARPLLGRLALVAGLFVAGFFVTSPYNFLDPSWMRSTAGDSLRKLHPEAARQRPGGSRRRRRGRRRDGLRARHRGPLPAGGARLGGGSPPVRRRPRLAERHGLGAGAALAPRPGGGRGAPGDALVRAPRPPADRPLLLRGGDGRRLSRGAAPLERRLSAPRDPGLPRRRLGPRPPRRAAAAPLRGDLGAGGARLPAERRGGRRARRHPPAPRQPPGRLSLDRRQPAARRARAGRRLRPRAAAGPARGGAAAGAPADARQGSVHPLPGDALEPPRPFPAAGRLRHGRARPPLVARSREARRPAALDARRRGDGQSLDLAPAADARRVPRPGRPLHRHQQRGARPLLHRQAVARRLPELRPLLPGARRAPAHENLRSARLARQGAGRLDLRSGRRPAVRSVRPTNAPGTAAGGCRGRG